MVPASLRCASARECAGVGLAMGRVGTCRAALSKYHPRTVLRLYPPDDGPHAGRHPRMAAEFYNWH
eukprot:11075849-Alexandrium_andersonii.AAC.1